MGNQCIVVEVTVNQNDLERLGNKDAASFVTLAFAVNEINVFQNLFLQCIPSHSRDETVRTQAGLQKLVLTRTLNAKI